MFSQLTFQMHINGKLSDREDDRLMVEAVTNDLTLFLPWLVET